MSQQNLQDKINSEVPEIEEAYIDSVRKFSSEFDVDIGSDFPEIDIMVEDDSTDSEDLCAVDVKFSNPDVYEEDMIENFSIVDGVEEVFKGSNVPLHEVVESASHAVAGIVVDGRERDSMQNLIVNEYFGALGLGFEDQKILLNDIEILKRNFDIQEDFFDSEQVDYVSSNLDDFRSVNDSLIENFEDLESDKFFSYAEARREDIRGDLPLTLSDFDEYSWDKKYDVGSFSEFFLDAFAVPSPIVDDRDIDDSEVENLLKHGNEVLYDLDENKISNLRDDVYERASRNNRSYLVSRLIARDTIEHELHDYSELVEMSNSEVWRRIGTDASRYNKEIIDEYDISSQNSGKLDLNLPGNLVEAA